MTEPLAVSAPLAWRLAPTLCRTDPASGESCAWYHGLWQYLRMLQFVEAPQYHAAFFEEALQTVTSASGEPRVLVSGAADYSMLAHVLAALRARGAHPPVTVVDACETPLALNRWYAERTGVDVVTRQDDILAYDHAGGFDAICTHAFLGRFPPAQRQELFARWHRLLRPGGSVITVTPVRPGHGTATVGFAPDQVQAFRAKVLAGAESLRDSLDVGPQLLADAAERYARHHRVYPVHSAQELEAMLRGAGFAIAHVSRVPPVADVHHGVQGPTVVGSAAYARVTAVRSQT